MMCKLDHHHFTRVSRPENVGWLRYTDFKSTREGCQDALSRLDNDPICPLSTDVGPGCFKEIQISSDREVA